MKFLNRFCLFLCLTSFHYCSLFSIVEKPLPKEEPRYTESDINEKNYETKKTEAEDRQKEYEKKKDEAERKKEEAKTEDEKANWDGEIKIYDYKIDQAKYDSSLVDKVEAQKRWDTSLSAEQRQQKLNSAKANLEAAEARIEVYSTELVEGYEPPSNIEALTNYRDIYEVVAGAVDKGFNVTDKLLTFGTEVSAVKEKPYEQQKEILVQLHDIATSQVDRGRELKDPDLEGSFQFQADELAKRIAEIETFLTPADKSKRERVQPQNAIINKLGLRDKIPMDQATTIIKETPNLLENADEILAKRLSFEDLKELTFGQKIEKLSQQELQQFKESLKEVLGAIEGFKLDVSQKYEKVISEIVDILKPKKEIEVSPEVENAQDQGFFSKALGGVTDFAKSYLPEGVVEGVGVATDVVSQFVAFTASDIAAGVQRVAADFDESFQNIRLAGEKLTELSISIQQYADMMADAPYYVDAVDYAAVTVDEKISKLDPLLQKVRMIPTERSRAIIDQVLATKSFAKVIESYKPTLDMVAGVMSETIAPALKRVGEFGQQVGEAISKPLEEFKTADEKKQAEYKEKLDQASDSIKQAREELLSKKRLSKYEKVVETVKAVGKKMGDWFKDTFFKPIDKKLTTRKETYTKAQDKYLEALGFQQGQKPTAVEIKTRLSEKLVDASDEFKQDLRDKTEALAQASSDLATVHKEFVDNLSSARANYEVMVKSWDAYVDTSKIPSDDIVSQVNTIFDMRDMKLAYLDAARSGLDKLANDMRSVTKDSDFEVPTDVFLDSLSRMVEGQLVDTIAEYDKIGSELGKAVTQSQETLKGYMTTSPIEEPG